ncbi:MAG: nucleotidyltransferase family protein [Planctomycetes bacterium]|nr:nucleotidyltransferase family protein [Planctomycetota bacterium]
MSHSARMFAVIPAAGLSRRMGQPKLLLKLAGLSIIERLLQALDSPLITERHVVVRPGDAALQAEVMRLNASLDLPPDDPPDMRASVAFALNVIEQKYAPCDNDGWLLVPADHPVLDRRLIEILLQTWQSVQPAILVPRRGTRRGHPTLFRWSLARAVANIPVDRGLNWLLREHAADVTELPVDSDAAVTDLDTPEDYRRLREKWEP